MDLVDNGHSLMSNELGSALVRAMLRTFDLLIYEASNPTTARRFLDLLKQNSHISRYFNTWKSESIIAYANLLHNEAILLKNLDNDYETAKNLLEESLRVTQTAHPRESNEVAQCFHSLGDHLLLRNPVDEEGYRLLVLAFTMYKNLGVKNIDVVKVLMAMAYVYRNRCSFSEAEDKLQLALGIAIEVDPKGQSVINAYNALGVLCKSRGDMIKALEHFKNALAVIESAEGSIFKRTIDHARILNNMADVQLTCSDPRTCPNDVAYNNYILVQEIETEFYGDSPDCGFYEKLNTFRNLIKSCPTRRGGRSLSKSHGVSFVGC